MTETDFGHVADVIRELPWSEEIVAITAGRMRRKLKAQYPRVLDENKFMARCGFSPVLGKANTWISQKHGIKVQDPGVNGAEITR